MLSVLDEEIRVLPKDLCKTPLEAVTEVIEHRFLDKVVPNLGLIVTLYDVQSLEGGFVYPNDGAAFFKVRFRVVVFRPFVGEVITGTLIGSTKEGVRVSLDFFNDVIVPEHSLQDPSFFNEAEKLWVWKFDGGCVDARWQKPIANVESFKWRKMAFSCLRPVCPLRAAARQKLAYRLPV